MGGWRSFVPLLLCLCAMRSGMAEAATRPQDLLLEACRNGPPTRVEEAIAAGADVSLPDDRGVPPLLWAAACNPNPDVPALLLEKGARPQRLDQKGLRGLLRAVSLDFREEALLSVTDERFESDLPPESRGLDALFAAAGLNASPNVLLRLAEKNASDVALSDGLCVASTFNPNPDVAAAFLKAGARIDAMNATGFTPLMLASGFNANPMVASILIQNGADINAKGLLDQTPLMMAAGFNTNAGFVSALIDAGVDVNYRTGDLGLSALVLAISNPNAGVPVTLIERGADIRVQDPKSGQSILIFAARYGAPETVAALLKAGADPEARDKSGKTALDYAETRVDGEPIAKLLKKGK